MIEIEKLKHTCKFYKTDTCYKLEFYYDDQFIFDLEYKLEDEDEITIPKTISYKIPGYTFKATINFLRTKFSTISEAQCYILKYLNNKNYI